MHLNQRLVVRDRQQRRPPSPSTTRPHDPIRWAPNRARKTSECARTICISSEGVATGWISTTGWKQSRSWSTAGGT